MIASRQFADGIAVPDDATVVELWRDPLTGIIGARAMVDLKTDRTIYCCDGNDAAQLPPLPVGGRVMVNGSEVTKPVTQSVPGSLIVEAGGHCRSAKPLVWQFQTREQIREDVRRERTARLTATDWTELPSAVLTVAQRLAFTTYRALLRDLPAKHPNATVETITWPKEP